MITDMKTFDLYAINTTIFTSKMENVVVHDQLTAPSFSKSDLPFAHTILNCTEPKIQFSSTILATLITICYCGRYIELIRTFENPLNFCRKILNICSIHLYPDAKKSHGLIWTLEVLLDKETLSLIAGMGLNRLNCTKNIVQLELG